MSREIKFRAWDSINNEMIYQGFHISSAGIKWAWLDHNYKDSQVIDFPIMQFTGLKDKNGIKDLYEGDVFHLGDPGITYVIRFKDACFNGRQIGNKSSVGLSFWNDRIVYVGDIYTNPYLLKGDKNV